MKTRIAWTVCALLMTLSISTVSSGVQVTNGPNVLLAQSPESHTINIQGDDGLLEMAEEEGWEGVGTEQHPIVIAGYDLYSPVHVFTIAGTTLHFVFENNTLDGLDDRWCVIVISNVENAVIRNNTIARGSVGIHLIQTRVSKIVSNDIYGQSWDSVYVETNCSEILIEGNHFHDLGEAGVYSEKGSYRTTVRKNVISDTMYGVSIKDSPHENTVFNNTILRVSVAGVYALSNNTEIKLNEIYHSDMKGIVLRSSFNTVMYNLIHNNDGEGIYVSGDYEQTRIIRNQLIRNADGGIRILGSCSNIIERNDLVENGIPQARDDGYENSFLHNYWDDAEGIDENNDGYIDIGYNITGSANSTDPEPKLEPNGAIPTHCFITEIENTTTSTSTTTIEEQTQTEPDNGSYHDLTSTFLFLAAVSGIVAVSLVVVYFRFRQRTV